MTTRFAVVVTLLILAGYAADQHWNDGIATLFLARKLIVLIDLLVFWR